MKVNTFTNNVQNIFYALSPLESKEENLNYRLIQRAVQEIIEEFKPFRDLWAGVLSNNLVNLATKVFSSMSLYGIYRLSLTYNKRISKVFEVFFKSRPIEYKIDNNIIIIELPKQKVKDNRLQADDLHIVCNYTDENFFAPKREDVIILAEKIKRKDNQLEENEILLPQELLGLAQDYCVYKLSTMYATGRQKVYNTFYQKFLVDKEKMLRAYCTENWVNKSKRQMEQLL